MTVNERLKEVVGILVSSGKAKNQAAIAEQIGYSKNFFSDTLNGRQKVSTGLISKMSAAFGVSPKWLMKGEGEQFDQPLGDRLRMVLNAKGISVYKLSSETGIPYDLISKIIQKEISTPNSEVLHAISSYLGVSPDWLLTGEGQLYEFDPLTLEGLPENLKRLTKDGVRIQILEGEVKHKQKKNDYLLDQLMKKDEEIFALQSENASLREEIEKLKK